MDWGEVVGDIAVYYVSLESPIPGIERSKDSDTCVDDAYDGAIVSTLDAVNNRECRKNDQPFQTNSN